MITHESPQDVINHLQISSRFGFLIKLGCPDVCPHSLHLGKQIESRPRHVLWYQIEKTTRGWSSWATVELSPPHIHAESDFTSDIWSHTNTPNRDYWTPLKNNTLLIQVCVMVSSEVLTSGSSRSRCSRTPDRLKDTVRKIWIGENKRASLWKRLYCEAHFTASYKLPLVVSQQTAEMELTQGNIAIYIYIIYISISGTFLKHMFH